MWAHYLAPSLALWPTARLIPAIVFLLVDPYNRDRFVRFHSFQCIGFWLAAVVIGAGLRVAGLLLFFVPLLGYLMVLLLSMVVSLGFFVIWVVLDREGAAGRDV